MMNSSFKIMTFMTPGLGVLVLGRGSYDYIVEKKTSIHSMKISFAPEH